MKKILKGLLISISAFCFLTNVNAYTITQINATESIGGVCPSCWYDRSLKQNVNSLVTVPYSVNYGGGNYAAYCLDPGKPDIKDVSVTATVTSVEGNPYYAGLHKIASEGYYNSNLTSGNIDKANYGATNLALRMLKIAMGRSEGGKTEYIRAIGRTAAKIMNENRDVANRALGTNCTSAACFYDTFGIGSKYGSNNPISTSVSWYNTAKSYFISGLTEAANTNGTGSSSGVGSDLAVSTSVPTAKANTSTQFVQKNYYDININGFTADNYVNGVYASCENCGSISGNPSVSISAYSLDNGATWTSGTPSDSALRNVNGTTKVILEVTTTINRNSGYDCTDVKVKVGYNYYAPTSDRSIVILRPTDSTANGQEFVAIIPSGSGNSDNISVSKSFNIDICENNFCEYYDPKDFDQMTEEEFEEYTEKCCVDLETLCNDNNNVAQQDYCDLYSEYCAACDTEIVIPTACQLTEDGEDSEVNIEGTTGYIKAAIDDDGNENIRACLLMRKKDEAGHSYKAMENSYCKVFCKEDYTFNLPDIENVNSGSFFQLEATISGTKTCYTSEIDTNKFMSDISGLSTGSEAYQQKVNEYNACVNMEVDYDCFDPKIEYEYEEIYNDQLGENDEFVKNGEIVETDKKTTYCNSGINDDYSCKDSSTKEISNIEGVAFTTKFVKSTVKKTGIYKTPSTFYSQHPSGTITTNGNLPNTTLVNGLPVSIKTEKGRHQFELRLKNIGEYYDQSSCKSGRIMGDENSVLDVKNKENGKTGKFMAEYMCYYDVNCPECEFDCEGPLCEIEQCDGKECKATCIGNGCAYDNKAGLSYAYRTVSLNSLNPSNRKLGYNWDVDNSVKAKETVRKIESDGENAYEEPEYSFTLTPALITAIKEYNRAELSNGGYANDTLTCSDDRYGNKNVNCESDFIAKLANGQIGNSSNNVTVPASDEKFTSWLDSDYCNGTCTITKRSGTGPSWK